MLLERGDGGGELGEFLAELVQPVLVGLVLLSEGVVRGGRDDLLLGELDYVRGELTVPGFELAVGGGELLDSVGQLVLLPL